MEDDDEIELVPGLEVLPIEGGVKMTIENVYNEDSQDLTKIQVLCRWVTSMGQTKWKTFGVMEVIPFDG